jgi:nucleoside-diphosphate-sugar epimerase
VRAVVTGCAGFIGSHLAGALLRDGWSVVGIDCFNDNYGRSQKLKNLHEVAGWDLFEFVPIDLARGDLGDLVEGCDIVFHLAAEPGVRASWGRRYEKYLQNNVLASQHLLEAMTVRPGIRLVYASSSSIYGEAAVHPTPESARPRPLSPYGQTKAAMEQICELYRHNHGVDVVGLRYFTVFGPRQRPDMAFHRICRAAIERTEFGVFGDGRQTRDFTYVGDVVDVTIAAATAELGGVRVFNIGGGAPTSLREAIDLIGQIAGQPLAVRYSDAERGDVRDTAADTALARDTLSFAPSWSLADGLAAEYEWLAGLLASEVPSAR